MKYGKEFAISIYVLSKNTSNLIENFVCGNSSIDYYFRNEALTDDSAVTYMFVDDDENCLISCMTIACSAIFIQGYEEIPFSTVISAMEVKYWATNVCYQHIPYSAESRHPSLSDYLFDYMIYYMKKLSCNQIGASKIVLYAVKKAVSFYTRHGFKKFERNMFGDKGTYLKGCIPMYFDMQ